MHSIEDSSGTGGSPGASGINAGRFSVAHSTLAAAIPRLPMGAQSVCSAASSQRQPGGSSLYAIEPWEPIASVPRDGELKASSTLQSPLGSSVPAVSSAAVPDRGPSSGTSSSMGVRPDIPLPPLNFPPAGLKGDQKDVDMTVMAYAQWLSEMKQQTTTARYHQQAELDVIRESINANSTELVELKRHSTQVVQQVQLQVSEMRAQLAEVVSQMGQKTRQWEEIEQRAVHRHSDLDTGRRSLAEHVERLQAEIAQLASGLRLAESEISGLGKALRNSQDQTIMKFGEMDQAFSMVHGHISSVKQEVAETKQDWKKGQDLLGQAIGTMSQDFTDFQKHTSMVLNKNQSDVFRVEELSSNDKDRLGRVEAQLAGIHQTLYTTTNELILMRADQASTRVVGVPDLISRQSETAQDAIRREKVANAVSEATQLLERSQRDVQHGIDSELGGALSPKSPRQLNQATSRSCGSVVRGRSQPSTGGRELSPMPTGSSFNLPCTAVAAANAVAAVPVPVSAVSSSRWRQQSSGFIPMPGHTGVAPVAAFAGSGYPAGVTGSMTPSPLPPNRLGNMEPVASWPRGAI